MTTVIKWLALVFALVGATLTALVVVPYNIYVMNVGSLLYAIWAWRVKDVNIFIVNFGLLCIYATGIVLHHWQDIIMIGF